MLSGVLAVDGCIVRRLFHPTSEVMATSLDMLNHRYSTFQLSRFFFNIDCLKINYKHSN